MTKMNYKNYKDGDTLINRVIEYVRSNPGAKRSQIIAGIGYEGPPMTISNTLARLRKEQVLEHRGGPPKHRQWDVISNETMPMFLEMANDILEELAEMHPSVRAVHLAQRLQDLLGETIDENPN